MLKDKRHRRMLLNVLVWTLLIVIVLISVGFLLVEKNSDNRQGSITASATTTATKVATTPATGKTATTTPDPGPSPDPSPDPDASATAPIASPTPVALFADDFMDNSNNWAITSSPDYTRMMEDDQLVLSVTANRILIESVPSTLSFGNYTLTMSYTLQRADKNDSMGLFLRGDSNLDHDYRIDIFGDRTVTINKEYLDVNKMPQTTQLLIKKNVSAIHAGAHSNILTVEMNGPTMSLTINGIVVVDSLYDPDYTRGQISLFVNNGTTSDGAIVSFNAIEVNSIPDPLPFASPTATPSITPTEDDNH